MNLVGINFYIQTSISRMKHIYLPLVFLLASVTLFSQQPDYLRSTRSQLNPCLYPFYHGVASGDPLSDRVILWTRITLNPTVDPVPVNWQVATDTAFSNIINSGTVITDSTKDYTIKVDVTGLQENTWYYYRFVYNGFSSITGRTRTLPTGNTNNLRFAVASCQKYQNGYYNAHRQLSQRNDIDAVLFLGDYTYESAADSVITGRYHEPPTKTVELIEYRMRQSQYHLDPDLQASHQQFPWICVWDDHETANNSYKDGAGSHIPATDGPWYQRKSNAVEAYYEWMPIRQPDVTDTFKIFRQFTWGDLIDLNMLDTRLYARDQQLSGNGQFISFADSSLNDTTRHLLGPEQFDWLSHNLDSSAAQWQILGQQVMMAPIVVPANVFGPDPVIVNPDQWDGYPYDRQKLYNHILNNHIQNVVVLTGDIHTSWANDLPLPGYDTAHRQNSIGVEFVTTSVTSGNDKLPPLVSETLIYSLGNYVRYVDLSRHGYFVLDVTPQKVQADFVYVSTISSKNFSTTFGPFMYVNSGEHFLRASGSPSTPQNTYPPLAVNTCDLTSVQEPANNLTTIMVHPNPFFDDLMIQFNTGKAEEIRLEVFSTTGALMFSKNLGFSKPGINYAKFNAQEFPSGFYVVRLSGANAVKSESVVKIN